MFGLIVLLCIGAMAVILFGVKQFKIGSQLSSVNQVANLSHTLVRQQANLFSVLLTNNAKSDQLVENLDNLVKENFVLDATIYDYNGKNWHKVPIPAIFVSNLVLSIKMKVSFNTTNC